MNPPAACFFPATGSRYTSPSSLLAFPCVHAHNTCKRASTMKIRSFVRRVVVVVGASHVTVRRMVGPWWAREQPIKLQWDGQSATVMMKRPSGWIHSRIAEQHHRRTRHAFFCPSSPSPWLSRFWQSDCVALHFSTALLSLFIIFFRLIFYFSFEHFRQAAARW